jgi:hypothetical protein
MSQACLDTIRQSVFISINFRRLATGWMIRESNPGGGFSTPLETGSGAYRASYTMGNRFFLGVKRLGRGIDHPPPSSAKVIKKE